MARLRGERALEPSGWHRGAKAVTYGCRRNNPNIDTINTNLGNQRLKICVVIYMYLFLYSNCSISFKRRR